MEKTWRFNGFGLRLTFFLLLLCLFNHNFQLCHSLNDEGLALLRFKDGIVSDPYGALLDWRQNEDEEDQNPCSWFGGCSHHGKVMTLNLKDLCLGGTLAPEVGSLIHIKSIRYRRGRIPYFLVVLA
ncbi:hypothetical protein MKW98_031932 [Papaver atlanticum]|uniref:Leucine-rich repeat-containing N-terminal plant-type domain-containing protein n=1 Tax=Papaver atlanticum TaxID=357466 RepID=A0AAD4SE84_9MAGN|nr:hypothetical protein MKW98_031932 [Papaver atlanticum]